MCTEALSREALRSGYWIAGGVNGVGGWPLAGGRVSSSAIVAQLPAEGSHMYRGDIVQERGEREEVDQAPMGPVHRIQAQEPAGLHMHRQAHPKLQGSASLAAGSIGGNSGAINATTDDRDISLVGFLIDLIHVVILATVS